MRREADKLLRDARTGVLALAILKILVDHGPLHGYGLRKTLSTLTGRDPPETSVYDALKRLERLGLASSYWARGGTGSLRKYYKATPIAGEVLEEALGELSRLMGWLLCRETG
ncbi:MAG: PadR family transcriptional regulator [Desulfurococcales archaeon]|nr:PadR family transcriptional regulator [Desulfurococcales archaeon]